MNCEQCGAPAGTWDGGVEVEGRRLCSACFPVPVVEGVPLTAEHARALRARLASVRTELESIRGAVLSHWAVVEDVEPIGVLHELWEAMMFLERASIRVGDSEDNFIRICGFLKEEK